MNTKIFQCQGCGCLVEVVRHWGPDLTCCGRVMKFRGQSRLEVAQEQPLGQIPPLDLTEITVGGKSFWQFA